MSERLLRNWGASPGGVHALGIINSSRRCSQAMDSPRRGPPPPMSVVGNCWLCLRCSPSRDTPPSPRRVSTTHRTITPANLQTDHQPEFVV